MLFSLPRLYLYSPFWQKPIFILRRRISQQYFSSSCLKFGDSSKKMPLFLSFLTQILTFVCVMNLFLGSSKSYTPVWVSVRYLK